MTDAKAPTKRCKRERDEDKDSERVVVMLQRQSGDDPDRDFIAFYEITLEQLREYCPNEEDEAKINDDDHGEFDRPRFYHFLRSRKRVTLQDVMGGGQGKALWLIIQDDDLSDE